jgi:hypothetical protein
MLLILADANIYPRFEEFLTGEVRNALIPIAYLEV